jgi:multiple sugar transport system substrate-binding protein
LDEYNGSLAVARATLTRRDLIKSIGSLALAGGALPACHPSPLHRPLAGTNPTGSQGTPTGAKVDVAIAVWTDPVRTWMKKFAQDWGAQHPEVTLEIDEIDSGDMAKTQLAELAAGTLQDVSYNAVTWIGYNIYKKAFLPLDDLVKIRDPGLDEHIPVAITSGKWQGKLFALPFEVTTGNSNIIVYNQNLLDAKGVKPPTDGWQATEFVDAIVKLTDKANGVYGTDYFPAITYHDFGALLRNYGAEILADDGIKFLLDQPRSIELVSWATEIVTRYHAAPNRVDSPSTSFPAGKVAYHAAGVQGIAALAKTIGDKFRWDAVLGHTGSAGRRGFDSFVQSWAIAATTKAPAKAYDLVTYLTSPDVQAWSFANQGQTPTRKALWESDTASKINPVWGRAMTWLTNGVDNGPLPMPNNLRYRELEDAWESSGYAIFYGEAPTADGIKKTQNACQATLELPPV